MAEIDYTDTLDKGHKVTSNAAALLRGVIDAAERGADVALEKLRPLAEQLDALFGNDADPVPAAPEGGVPVDTHVESDEQAAADAGVVTA